MSTRPKAEPTSVVRRRRSESVATRVLTGRPARQRAAALCFAVFPTDWIEFIQLQGVVDGNALLERDNRLFKREFARDVEAAADRALRRYVKPADIDEAWKLTTRLTFNYVTCATCR